MANITNLFEINSTAETYSALDLFLINNINYFEILLYVLYTLVFVLGVFGNMLVIYVLMSSMYIDRRYTIQNNPAVAHLIATSMASRQVQRKYSNELDGLVTGAGGENEVDNAPAPVIAVIRRVPGKEPTQSLMSRSSLFFKKMVREKLSVTNLYLLNLAICDFLYVLSIPILLCTIYFSRWQFNKVFCKVYFAQIYLCQCSIVFILVVLSVDRFLSVKFPHRVAQFRSGRAARITICGSWFLSFLVILPIPIYSELHFQPTENVNITTPTCLIHWPDSWSFKNKTEFTTFLDTYLSPLHAFNAYTFLLNYLLPVIIIVILYTGILRSLHGTGSNSVLHKSKMRKKSNKKITKMVLTIIICYIVCWTPYWCLQVFLYLYLHVFKGSHQLIFTILSNFIQVLCYMSSMLNPFIYSYMSEAFRQDLELALAQIGCCLKVVVFWERRKIAAEARRQMVEAAAAAAAKLKSKNHQQQQQQNTHQPLQTTVNINKNNKNATVTTTVDTSPPTAETLPMNERNRTLPSEGNGEAPLIRSRSSRLRRSHKVIVLDDELENQDIGSPDKAVECCENGNEKEDIDMEVPMAPAFMPEFLLTESPKEESEDSQKLVVVERPGCEEKRRSYSVRNQNCRSLPEGDASGGKKDLSTRRKLVLRSSRKYEFEIKFHGLSGSSTKFLDKMFNKNQNEGAN